MATSKDDQDQDLFNVISISGIVVCGISIKINVQEKYLIFLFPQPDVN